MEEHAQTMSIPTPAPVGLAILASTVKPTFLTAQRVLALMEVPAQIESMDIPVPVVRASLVPTVSMRSMSVIPNRA